MGRACVDELLELPVAGSRHLGDVWLNEATSARVALLLRKQGVSRIRPPVGGFQAWLDRRFPVEPLTIEPRAAS